MHQTRVRDVVEMCGRIDAHDPQSAELPFSLAPVAIRELQRSLNLLAGDAVELGLGEVIAFGSTQDLLASEPAFVSSFHTGHLWSSLPTDVQAPVRRET
jgi:hypothetical protein